ncbi:hypothetical protein BJ508DRAFT_336692 [Ascobolus immersus RN42]|uniref:Uncharacterized protein n=1 Tax=Ascobolus immersus RN42 TaxID=1160509 RepID=A0A3N4HAE5_ASCIM|nr:hypothetical protein BJ508DRAFT_336692 [Ascobolus immersus RN42]
MAVTDGSDSNEPAKPPAPPVHLSTCWFALEQTVMQVEETTTQLYQLVDLLKHVHGLTDPFQRSVNENLSEMEQKEDRTVSQDEKRQLLNEIHAFQVGSKEALATLTEALKVPGILFARPLSWVKNEEREKLEGDERFSKLLVKKSEKEKAVVKKGVRTTRRA